MSLRYQFVRHFDLKKELDYSERKILGRERRINMLLADYMLAICLLSAARCRKSFSFLNDLVHKITVNSYGADAC